MKTISKRADQLQPGDMVDRGPGAGGKIIVVGVSQWDGTITVSCVLRGGVTQPFAQHALTLKADDTVYVQAPALTPAQERADELAELLRQGVDWAEGRGIAMPSCFAAARVLLDEIDPPSTPTLEELALALQALAEYAMLDPERLDDDDRRQAEKAEKDASALLNRARKAGLIE